MNNFAAIASLIAASAFAAPANADNRAQSGQSQVQKPVISSSK
ncbi:hypothetical protein [Pseudomonas sp. RL_15y_Pfl2_60]